jgi:hypothetical protein
MNESYRNYRNSLSVYDLLFDDRGNIEGEISVFQTNNLPVPSYLYRMLEAVNEQIASYGSTDCEPVVEPEFQPVLEHLKMVECRHLIIVEDHIGSMWFNGDVCDDIRTIVKCADCGFIFSGKEE